MNSLLHPTTVAVIDIGSNSIKLLVAQSTGGSGLAPLKTHTLDVRISAGIAAAQPQLNEEGMDHGVEAIRQLLLLAAPLHPQRTLLVATSAVRDAVNGATFRARVEEATGHPVRILGGKEEAHFIGVGLTCDPALAYLRDFYVFDLGGGSLECLSFRDRVITQSISLQLGCVRMTERYVPDPAPPLTLDARELITARTRITLLESGFNFDLGRDAPAVFTGGSMTNARLMRPGSAGGRLENTPAVVTTAELKALLEAIAPLTLAERKQMPGMAASRADVFPAALVTMVALADLAGITRFHHSLYNLRWGIAAEVLLPAVIQ